MYTFYVCLLLDERNEKDLHEITVKFSFIYTSRSESTETQRLRRTDVVHHREGFLSTLNSSSKTSPMFWIISEQILENFSTVFHPHSSNEWRLKHLNRNGTTRKASESSHLSWLQSFHQKTGFTNRLLSSSSVEEPKLSHFRRCLLTGSGTDSPLDDHMTSLLTTRFSKSS